MAYYKNITYFMKVVGVTFNNRQDIIENLNVGDPLIFVREENNPYDSNAMQICNVYGEQIGYVSKEHSEEVVTNLSIGAHYRLTVSAITGGGFDSNYGVNVKVEAEIPC